MARAAEVRPVLIVSDAAEFGGAEKYVEFIASHLEDILIKVLLVGPGCAELERRLDRLGIVVDHADKSVAGWVELLYYLFRHRSWLFHLNLTHLDSCRRVLLASLFLPAVPVIATLHAYVPLNGGKVKVWLKRLVWRRFTMFISPSDFVANELRIANLIDKNKIQVIYNGVEGIKTDRPTRLPNVFEILCLGRLDKDKGYQHLLRALADLPSELIWHCTMVGDGPFRQDLQELCDRWHLDQRVEFTGFQTDIDSYVLASSVLVLPSLHENFPLTILEAMSAGRAVVATRVGGIPEQVEDNRTGILVEAADSQQLAEALRRLATKPELLKHMGYQAKKRFDELFAGDGMAKRIKAMYAALS